MNDVRAELEEHLFQTSTHLIDFVIIETEFRQFADYGFHLSEFSRAKLDDLKSDLSQPDVRLILKTSIA
jgi:hypothetical protein